MGVLRILLALAVLFSHVGQMEVIKFINSGVAVYSFFIISGFYIAMVLDQKYRGPGSASIFYANRYLRLWPTYAISLLIILFAVFQNNTLGVAVSSFKSLPFLHQMFVLFSNFSFVGLDLLYHVNLGSEGVVFSEYGVNKDHTGSNFIFNQPAWSIWIELMFYLAAPFVVRSLKSSCVFMLLGIAFILSLRHLPQIFGQYRYDLYYPYFFAFFGLGSVSYWLSSKSIELKSWIYVVGTLISLAFLAMPMEFGSSYYLLLAFAIPQIFELTKSSKIDRFIGDLSYPIYILHLPIHAVMISQNFLPSKSIQTVIVTLVISILVVVFIERPIGRARERWTLKKLAKS